jgi:hypothetical protein
MLMRLRMGLLAAVLAGVGLWLASNAAQRAATADDKAAESDYGTVTGQLLLEGEIPERKVLVAAGAVVNGAAVCAAANILSDELLVNPETKGIANVFVYLPKAAHVHPQLRESATKEVVFDQKGCRFIPHALFARTDQVVVVKSDDGCAHNTRTVPLRNQPVNLVLTPNDRTGKEVKNKASEKLPMEVQCNIHAWMKAYWLILDHPYAAVTDANGKFKIADLPAGEHELAIWHEKTGYLERKFKVKVVAGETTDVGAIKVPVAKFEKK